MRDEAHLGGSGAAGGPGVPATPEWAGQALDKVDEVVAKVRAATTDRLVKLARLVVIGLLVATMGVTALVLAVIAAIRGMDEAVPGRVWSVYLILGAIFSAAGAFLWSKKKAQVDRP